MATARSVRWKPLPLQRSWLDVDARRVQKLVKPSAEDGILVGVNHDGRLDELGRRHPWSGVGRQGFEKEVGLGLLAGGSR